MKNAYMAFVVGWLFLAGGVWLFGSGTMLLAVMGLLVLLGGIHIKKYLVQLRGRMAGDQALTWVVSMNDVEIGTITDAQYATMWQSVLFDRQVLLEQFLNFVKVAWVITCKTFYVVPFIFFWLVVFAALSDPESYTAIMQDLLKADAAPIRLMVIICISFAVVAHAFAAVLGDMCGFKNHYDAAMHRRVRLFCNVVAEGYIRLQREDVLAKIREAVKSGTQPT